MQVIVVLPRQHRGGSRCLAADPEGDRLPIAHTWYGWVGRAILAIDEHGAIVAGRSHFETAHHVAAGVSCLDHCAHGRASAVQPDRAVGNGKKGRGRHVGAAGGRLPPGIGP